MQLLDASVSAPFAIPPGTPALAARSSISFGPFASFGIGNGGDNARIFNPAPAGGAFIGEYGNFTRAQGGFGLSNSEGRVWDGGPRGYEWSPAAASFDQYPDFEARGEAFRAAVLALGATPASAA